MFEINAIEADTESARRGRAAIPVNEDVVMLYTALKEKDLSYAQYATIRVERTELMSAQLQRAVLNRDLKKLVKADNENESATVRWVVNVGPLVLDTKSTTKGSVKIRLYNRPIK